jgi:2-polyprenyl-3-methyl-5-hydroxy-6-metoxy-1,4-benzoquinol methylase
MSAKECERVAEATIDAQPYTGYESWKGWKSYFRFSVEEEEYFTRELCGIPLAGKRVLEIGFGSGAFLAWARAQGADIAGTEILSRSLAEAFANEVEILPVAIEAVRYKHRNRFDVIAAFDVFEHFEIGEIAIRIEAVTCMLKPGGYLVLRFPNGQSPFGLGPQNGDATHKTALSKDKLEQICEGMNLKTVRYAGVYSTGGSTRSKRLVRVLRSAARSLIGVSLNFIYGTAHPWDAVVVLVLEKESETPRVA